MKIQIKVAKLIQWIKKWGINKIRIREIRSSGKIINYKEQKMRYKAAIILRRAITIQFKEIKMGFSGRRTRPKETKTRLEEFKISLKAIAIKLEENLT